MPVSRFVCPPMETSGWGNGGFVSVCMWETLYYTAVISTVLKNLSKKSEHGCKLDVSETNLKSFFVFEPFWVSLYSKFAKSANRIQKVIFCYTSVWESKNSKFYVAFEFVEKIAKSSPKS